MHAVAPALEAALLVVALVVATAAAQKQQATVLAMIVVASSNRNWSLVETLETHSLCAYPRCAVSLARAVPLSSKNCSTA